VATPGAEVASVGVTPPAADEAAEHADGTDGIVGSVSSGLSGPRKPAAIGTAAGVSAGSGKSRGDFSCPFATAVAGMFVAETFGRGACSEEGGSSLMGANGGACTRGADTTAGTGNGGGS